MLVDRIVKLCADLVRDQYGNYVVQYVIELKSLDANAKIADNLSGSIKELANQKFSSNVIEKVCFITICSNTNLTNSALIITLQTRSQC